MEITYGVSNVEIGIDPFFKNEMVKIYFHSRTLTKKSKVGLMYTLQIFGIVYLFKESPPTRSMYRKAIWYNPTMFINDSQFIVTSKHFLSKGTNEICIHSYSISLIEHFYICTVVNWDWFGAGWQPWYYCGIWTLRMALVESVWLPLP